MFDEPFGRKCVVHGYVPADPPWPLSGISKFDRVVVVDPQLHQVLHFRARQLPLLNRASPYFLRKLCFPLRSDARGRPATAG